MYSLMLESGLYTYEYFLQEDICRLCWKRDAIREIFAQSKIEESVKNKLSNKIKVCLGIKLNKNIHPYKICNLCCEEIEKFYRFKLFCRDADKKLTKILNRGKTQHILPPKENTLPTEDVKNEIQNDFDACFEIKEEFDTGHQENTGHQRYTDHKEITGHEKNTGHQENTDDQDNIGHKETSDHVEDTGYQENTGHEEITGYEKDTDHQENTEDIGHDTETSLKEEAIKKKKKPYYVPKKSATYCTICKTDYESTEKLILHKSQSHGIEKDGMYRCFGCKKTFKTRRCRTHHEINFCKGLKDGYKCTICNRFLPQRRMYEIHARAHTDNCEIDLPENIFKCKKCEESFGTKEDLRNHTVTTHEGLKKNFVCHNCGRSFSRQDYLHKHMLTHTGVRQYECTYCGFRSAQRSSLIVHIRKHTGERPYLCDLCPQRCVSSSNLRVHRRRHLGVKLFECSICKKKFGYKMSLDEHVAAAHQSSQVYACELCSATYTRVRGLKRHLSAKHKPETEKVAVFMKMADISMEKKLVF